MDHGVVIASAFAKNQSTTNAGPHSATDLVQHAANTRYLSRISRSSPNVFAKTWVHAKGRPRSCAAVLD